MRPSTEPSRASCRCAQVLSCCLRCGLPPTLPGLGGRPASSSPSAAPAQQGPVHAVGGRRAAAARAGSGAWLAEAGTPVGHDCRTPWAQDPLGAGRCP